MKVVLLKNSQVKDVADGYARNYLIPNGLAVAATPDAIAKAEKKQSTENAQKQKEQDQASKAETELADAKIELHAQANEDGTLFAAIPESDILQAIQEQKNIQLKAGVLQLKEPVKHTGEHAVTLSLPHGSQVNLQLIVSAK